jgi:hypothetical protein
LDYRRSARTVEAIANAITAYARCLSANVECLLASTPKRDEQNFIAAGISDVLNVAKSPEVTKAGR